MIVTYVNKLKLQFCSAKGIDNINIKIEDEDFINWLNDQQKVKEYYQHYLLTMGLFYNDRTSVEVGKGKYDTITSSDTLATIITGYASTFCHDSTPKKIICGELINNSKGNFVLVEDRIKRGHHLLSLEHSNLFYTQNAHANKDVTNLLQIHNNGGNVVIGAYGNLQDKDRIAKIRYLRELKSCVINNTIKEEYAYVNDSYVYFLHTNYAKVKKYNIKK